MAWMIFTIFALAVPLVNGDDNTDVVQVTLRETVEKGLAKVAERVQTLSMENWQEESNQMVSELEAIGSDHPHHHSNHHHSDHPHHHSNHHHGVVKKKHFTKTELKAGREFLDQYNHSNIYLEAKKTMHGYLSVATVFRAREGSDAANFTDAELLTYKEPWCKELKLAYGEKICNDAYGYTLSNAWYHTKCMLEACVDGNETHPTGCLGPHGGTRLMILVEMYDSLMKQMPDITKHLLSADIQDFDKPDFCPGEEEAILLKIKKSQNNMLARHHQIQQAMTHTRAVAEGLLATASTASNEEHAEDSIQRVWEHICGHLKCDHGSWMDIHDAMHGHVVDLSEEGMPARTLIEHVRSLRKTHDAVMQAFQKSTKPGMDDFLTTNATSRPRALSLYQMVTKTSTGESGSSRYEALGKELLAVADAAYALKHGSMVHLTWWPFCLKIVAGANIIYGMAPIQLALIPVPPPGVPIPVNLCFGVNLNCGGLMADLNMSGVFDALWNGGIKAALNDIKCNFKITASIGAGVGLEDDMVTGIAVQAGVAIGMSFELKDYSIFKTNNQLTLSTGVVFGAGLTYARGKMDPAFGGPPECMLGSQWPEWPLMGVKPWKCKFNYGAGIGFICMDFKILPKDEMGSDAAKDMPRGETSYGRDCSGDDDYYDRGASSGFHGKYYMWCYTESGGWDYTCPVTNPAEEEPSKTTRDKECFKSCGFKGYEYKWCYLDEWDNWDYCCVQGFGTAGNTSETQRNGLLETP